MTRRMFEQCLNEAASVGLFVLGSHWHEARRPTAFFAQLAAAAAEDERRRCVRNAASSLRGPRSHSDVGRRAQTRVRRRDRCDATSRAAARRRLWCEKRRHKHASHSSALSVLLASLKGGRKQQLRVFGVPLDALLARDQQVTVVALSLVVILIVLIVIDSHSAISDRSWWCRSLCTPASSTCSSRRSSTRRASFASRAINN